MIHIHSSLEQFHSGYLGEDDVLVTDDYIVVGKLQLQRNDSQSGN